MVKSKNYENNKICQVSMEYLIIIGFVTFAAISIILIAFFYSGIARDRIVLSQVEVFAKKITNSAESVFYAGEPSQVQISVYLPRQISSIEILNYDIIITTSTSSGIVKQAFSSKVKLEGFITSTEGIKRLTLKASQDKVTISQ